MTNQSPENLLCGVLVVSVPAFLLLWRIFTLPDWYAKTNQLQPIHYELLTRDSSKQARWNRAGCLFSLVIAVLAFLPALLFRHPLGLLAGMFLVVPLILAWIGLNILDTGFYYYNGTFGPQIFTEDKAKLVGIGFLAMGVLCAVPWIWLASGFITVLTRR